MCVGGGGVKPLDSITIAYINNGRHLTLRQRLTSTSERGVSYINLHVSDVDHTRHSSLKEHDKNNIFHL